jgi:hypothetical protein
MTVRIPSISTEYARVNITGDVTLSTQTVELAFMSDRSTEPGSGDWHSATWLGSSGTSRDAGVLVGPAALVLTGTVYVWFRVTDTPEIPARYAGTITIT